ncbi:MAG: UDP-glucose 4-epimerase GalE [Alicyclobacillus sp.]|nr:UDP-glucose 4-epimerase GalE [Alicyclobacillus sp.]
MALLITGGAGYIGSHTARWLQQQGEQVVLLDNLQSGHRAAALQTGAPFYACDLRDREQVGHILRRHDIEAVLHLAGRSLVAESVHEPLLYYADNVGATTTFLQTLVDHGIRRVVFSSTAAVYGNPVSIPLHEDHPLQPVNPYGASKLAVEQLLAACWQAYGLASVSLRYFNVAGAWEDGTLGEAHQPETHLIPNVLQVAAGLRPHLTVYGDDYPTPDGTCIRDFVHVLDVARAHHLAVRRLRTGSGGALVYNLGSTHGWSVLEVVAAARRITGHPIPVCFAPRRLGDPPVLVAAAALASEHLGWQPRASLDDMLASAWRWQVCHPRGFYDDGPGRQGQA